MPPPAAPKIECQQLHAILSVRDLQAAADFYTTKLGFWLAFTWGNPPTMAGVNLDCVQIFLELGTPAPESCSVYFVVGDADALYEFQRQSGVEIVEPPEDKPWGLREFTARDLDGYRLVFGHHLRKSEPGGDD